MLAQPKKGGTEKGFAYHEEENYYQVGQEQGQFHGKLKDELGFTNLDREALFNSLDGNDANGNRVVKTRADGLDENGHRKNAYTDLTFHADKSVSVAYEQALKKDPELAAKLSKVHQQAVRTTLDYIEKEYTYSRIDKKANDKALFLLYDHFDARMVDDKLDPSLHTHALMVNITQNENGTYNKLENEHIARDHKMLGLLYRNEMANLMQKEGIEIEVFEAKQGFFQMKGFSKEQREEFSQRSKQIAEWVKENEARIRETNPNITMKKLKDIAQAETRGYKDKNVDKSEYIKKNEERAAAVDYQLPTHDHKIEARVNIESIYKAAIEDISDKQSVWSRKDLLNQMSKISMGSVTLNEMVNAIETNEELITIKKDRYTTKEVLQKEEFIFSQKAEKNFTVTKNKNQIEKAIKAFETEKGFELKEGQRDLANTVLSSDSQFIIAQGVAGAGKSTSLEIVRKVAENNDINIVALAPTGTATDNLAKEAGIKQNMTVAKFIQEQGADIKNSLVIVDEAGMMGLRDTHELLKIAKENNLKIVFSGDMNQKKSISQGDIFPGMQRKGFETVNLAEGNRQKTEKMKLAVKNILDRDIVAGLEVLKDSVFEMKGDERLNGAMRQYLKDRDNSLLITTTNSDRVKLNEMIRNHLLKTNEITNSKEFGLRETINLSDLEKRSALHYKEGQKVFLSKNLGSISAGREALIKSVDLNKNQIIIEHKSMVKGKQKITTQTVDLTKEGNKLNLFEDKKKNLGIGDQVIMKKNDRKIGISNGQMGKVTDIKGDQLTIQFDSKEVKFSIKDYKYINHAYAITDFASQGKTTDKVIAVANSQAASFNDFYTQITRAKNEAVIICDSKEELQKRAAMDSIKLNATELVQENNNQIKELKKENIQMKTNIEIVKENKERREQFQEEQQQKQEKEENKIEKTFDRFEKVNDALEIAEATKKFNNRKLFENLKELNQDSLEKVAEAVSEIAIEYGSKKAAIVVSKIPSMSKVATKENIELSDMIKSVKNNILENSKEFSREI